MSWKLVITVEEDHAAEEFVSEVREVIENYYGDSAYFEIKAGVPACGNPGPNCPIHKGECD